MLKNKFKIWETALLISLCLSLCVGTWAQSKQTVLGDSLVRLHVIADSDSDEEQSLKLRVRDAVLEYISPKLKDAEDPGSAYKIISSELKGIRTAAEEKSEGRQVKVTLSEEYYPTRHYDGGFSLPAGKYRSLRVIIGEGEGHNWWCVVFPPLCVSAAERQDSVSSMSGEVQGIVSDDGERKISFRILELWGGLREFLNID